MHGSAGGEIRVNAGDRALLTYFNYQGGISLSLQGIPVKWFYD